MMEFRLPVRGYIEDTDAGGIVYYVNYLKYMERARTELMRSLGYDKPAVFDHQLMFVVHSLSIQYLKPASLDDQLQATALISNARRSYFEVEQRVLRNDDVLCQGSVKVACVDQNSQRPRAMPTDMLTSIRKHIEDEATNEG